MCGVSYKVGSEQAFIIFNIWPQKGPVSVQRLCLQCTGTQNHAVILLEFDGRTIHSWVDAHYTANLDRPSI